MNDADDTIIRKVSIPAAALWQPAVHHIADALEMLSGVLARYPERHADVWASAAWQKDAKDLEIACGLLRKHAAELRAVAGGDHAAP